MQDDIITVNEHSVRIYIEKKINYAYSNKIMNHNNAEFFKRNYIEMYLYQ